MFLGREERAFCTDRRDRFRAAGASNFEASGRLFLKRGVQHFLHEGVDEGRFKNELDFLSTRPSARRIIFVRFI